MDALSRKDYRRLVNDFEQVAGKQTVQKWMDTMDSVTPLYKNKPRSTRIEEMLAYTFMTGQADLRKSHYSMVISMWLT